MPQGKRAIDIANRVKAKLGVTSNPRASDVVKFRAGENWAEHWHEFYTALQPSGLYKYKTVKRFAEVVTAIPIFQAFTCWYIGPPVEKADETDEQKTWRERFGGPQDWVQKRANHGWFTDSNIRALSVSIAQRYSALDSMREVGNKVIAQSLIRSAELMSQLDLEYNGRFFVEGLTEKQNRERADYYIQMHERLSALQDRALKRFALSNGINFDDTNALTTLLAGAIQSQASGASALQPNQLSVVDRISAQLAKTAISKAASFNLPLPDKMAEEIVDITAEPSPSNKKKNVQ